jgi:hypothetical protein
MTRVIVILRLACSESGEVSESVTTHRITRQHAAKPRRALEQSNFRAMLLEV